MTALLKVMPRTTFGQFLDEFRRDFGGWSANTWRGNSGMLKRLCEEFGGYRLTEITPRQVDGYLNRRRREGLTEATVNRYLCGLKTLFAVAKLWEYVESSPVAEIRTLKEQGKIPEALTDDELRGLVAQCPPKLKAIVTLAADTGMRKSELQRLTWADIDFDARTITIRKSKNKDYRVIPMTVTVGQLLFTLRSSANGTEQVIPFVDVGRSLSRASQKAGIKHVHLHMLRHTFATRLRDRGVPLDRIMELMGHRSMEMVLRYAKARPQQLIQAMRSLDEPPKSSNQEATYVGTVHITEDNRPHGQGDREVVRENETGCVTNRNGVQR